MPLDNGQPDVFVLHNSTQLFHEELDRGKRVAKSARAVLNINHGEKISFVVGYGSRANYVCCRIDAS